MDDDPMVKTRKALNSLWNKALLRGRTWGSKKIVNPFAGTNITLVFGEELVTISQTKKSKLLIHEFSLTQNTKLGKEIREIIKKEKITIAK